jgi:hypothetical protein
MKRNEYALWMTIRRALLLAADAIKVYCDERPVTEWEPEIKAREADIPVIRRLQ